MRLKTCFLSEPDATTMSSYYLSSMETKDSILRDKEILLTNSTPQQELTEATSYSRPEATDDIYIAHIHIRVWKSSVSHVTCSSKLTTTGADNVCKHKWNNCTRPLDSSTYDERKVALTIPNMKTVEEEERFIGCFNCEKKFYKELPVTSYTVTNVYK